jgi:hypothetical protein
MPKIIDKISAVPIAAKTTVSPVIMKISDQVIVLLRSKKLASQRMTPPTEDQRKNPSNLRKLPGQELRVLFYRTKGQGYGLKQIESWDFVSAECPPTLLPGGQAP